MRLRRWFHAFCRNVPHPSGVAYDGNRVPHGTQAARIGVDSENPQGFGDLVQEDQQGPWDQPRGLKDFLQRVVDSAL